MESMRTDGRGQETPLMLPGEAEKQKEDRAQKIAQGIAMLSDGKSYRQAPAKTGLALSVLHRHYAGVCSHGTEREKEALDAHIVAHAYHIADLTALEITSRLEAPEKRSRMTLRELTTGFGVATDKIAARRQWSRPQDQGTEGWLGALAGALSRVRSVTVQLEDPVVDVTPSQNSK